MAEIIGLKLMTYNIGGGRKDLKSVTTGILEILQKENPDILAIQEATTVITTDDSVEAVSQIAQKMDYDNYYFGPTLSMAQNFSANKSLFVYGIFNDWTDWQQGNALFSRWQFVNFKTPTIGSPRNIPIYNTHYEGSRDTEPRFVVIAKVDHPVIPFYVLTTHLTTLYGERGDREIPRVLDKARELRFMQCSQIINLIKEHLLQEEQLVILLGDFNADVNESCIQALIANGFFRLSPKEEVGTHPKRDKPIDHIFVHPGKYFVNYKCQIIKNTVTGNTTISPSDHLPVLAEIDIYDQKTESFGLKGSGVMRKENK